MSLSLRGIARHYRNVTGSFSVDSGIFEASPVRPVSVRKKLIILARQQFIYDVSECIFSWTGRFEQTWSLIRVRIQLNPDPGITATTIATLRTTWENGIRKTWNNRWGVGRSGEATCPLQFDVEWVTSNPHHSVRVRVRTNPQQVANKGTWYTNDSGAVAAHEFGHMLGLVDEYQDIKHCPARNPVNTGMVMDNNSANVPARMMQRFADNIGSTVVAI